MYRYEQLLMRKGKHSLALLSAFLGAVGDPQPTRFRKLFTIPPLLEGEGLRTICTVRLYDEACWYESATYGDSSAGDRGGGPNQSLGCHTSCITQYRGYLSRVLAHRVKSEDRGYRTHKIFDQTLNCTSLQRYFNKFRSSPRKARPLTNF